MVLVLLTIKQLFLCISAGHLVIFFHILVLFHVFIYFHYIFFAFKSLSFDLFVPLHGFRYRYGITSIILSLELPLIFQKVIKLIKNIIK